MSSLGLATAVAEEVQEQAKAVAEVAKTLEESTGSQSERKGAYERLQQEYGKKGPFEVGMSKMMGSWKAGLFVEAK